MKVAEDENIKLKTEEELRRELIQVQIESMRKKNARGWLWHLGPNLGAITASIGASVIVILFGSQIVKEYFDSKVSRSEQRSTELEARNSQLLILIDNKSDELKKLERNIQAANLELSAKNDLISRLGKSDEIGLGVDIKVQEKQYVLSIGTRPQGVTISVFAGCSGNYVFPNQYPNPKDCQILFEPQCTGKSDSECSDKACKTSKIPCIFNNIARAGGNTDNSLWVSAEFNGVRTVKYIYLGK